MLRNLWKRRPSNPLRRAQASDQSSSSSFVNELLHLFIQSDGKSAGQVFTGVEILEKYPNNYTEGMQSSYTNAGNVKQFRIGKSAGDTTPLQNLVGLYKDIPRVKPKFITTKYPDGVTFAQYAEQNELVQNESTFYSFLCEILGKIKADLLIQIHAQDMFNPQKMFLNDILLPTSNATSSLPEIKYAYIPRSHAVTISSMDDRKLQLIATSNDSIGVIQTVSKGITYNVTIPFPGKVSSHLTLDLNDEPEKGFILDTMALDDSTSTARDVLFYNAERYQSLPVEVEKTEMIKRARKTIAQERIFQNFSKNSTLWINSCLISTANLIIVSEPVDQTVGERLKQLWQIHLDLKKTEARFKRQGAKSKNNLATVQSAHDSFVNSMIRDPLVRNCLTQKQIKELASYTPAAAAETYLLRDFVFSSSKLRSRLTEEQVTDIFANNPFDMELAFLFAKHGLGKKVASEYNFPVEDLAKDKQQYFSTQYQKAKGYLQDLANKRTRAKTVLAYLTDNTIPHDVRLRNLDYVLSVDPKILGLCDDEQLTHLCVFATARPELAAKFSPDATLQKFFGSKTTTHNPYSRVLETLTKDNAQNKFTLEELLELAFSISKGKYTEIASQAYNLLVKKYNSASEVQKQDYLIAFCRKYFDVRDANAFELAFKQQVFTIEHVNNVLDKNTAPIATECMKFYVARLLETKLADLDKLDLNIEEDAEQLAMLARDMASVLKFAKQHQLPIKINYGQVHKLIHVRKSGTASINNTLADLLSDEINQLTQEQKQELVQVVGTMQPDKVTLPSTNARDMVNEIPSDNPFRVLIKLWEANKFSTKDIYNLNLNELIDLLLSRNNIDDDTKIELKNFNDLLRKNNDLLIDLINTIMQKDLAVQSWMKGKALTPKQIDILKQFGIQLKNGTKDLAIPGKENHQDETDALIEFRAELIKKSKSISDLNLIEILERLKCVRFDIGGLRGDNLHARMQGFANEACESVALNNIDDIKKVFAWSACGADVVLKHLTNIFADETIFRLVVENKLLTADVLYQIVKIADNGLLDAINARLKSNDPYLDEQFKTLGKLRVKDLRDILTENYKGHELIERLEIYALGKPSYRLQLKDLLERNDTGQLRGFFGTKEIQRLEEELKAKRDVMSQETLAKVVATAFPQNQDPVPEDLRLAAREYLAVYFKISEPVTLLTESGTTTVDVSAINKAKCQLRMDYLLEHPNEIAEMSFDEARLIFLRSGTENYFEFVAQFSKTKTDDFTKLLLNDKVFKVLVKKMFESRYVEKYIDDVFELLTHPDFSHALTTHAKDNAKICAPILIFCIDDIPPKFRVRDRDSREMQVAEVDAMYKIAQVSKSIPELKEWVNNNPDFIKNLATYLKEFVKPAEAGNTIEPHGNRGLNKYK